MKFLDLNGLSKFWAELKSHLSSKISRPPTYAAGNIPQFTEDGQLEDTGIPAFSLLFISSQAWMGNAYCGNSYLTKEGESE